MDFYISMAVHTVIGILATTIKNPTSSKAQTLRKYIQELSDACIEFLAATAPHKEIK
jgi:hypothetical protein